MDSSVSNDTVDIFKSREYVAIWCRSCLCKRENSTLCIATEYWLCILFLKNLRSLAILSGGSRALFPIPMSLLIPLHRPIFSGSHCNRNSSERKLFQNPLFAANSLLSKGCGFASHIVKQRILEK